MPLSFRTGYNTDREVKKIILDCRVFVEKEAVVKVGGSIEKALVGDYRLNVADILKEAWALTKEARVSINLGLLFCLASFRYDIIFSFQLFW